MTTNLAPLQELLPPLQVGNATPTLNRRTEEFYGSIAEMFEAWIRRRRSPHTQRAYRQDVMGLVQFLEIPWPAHSFRLLTVTVQDVQAYRDMLRARDAAPKTLNRRVASISGFYKYLAGGCGRVATTHYNPQSRTRAVHRERLH